MFPRRDLVHWYAAGAERLRASALDHHAGETGFCAQMASRARRASIMAWLSAFERALGVEPDETERVAVIGRALLE